MLRETRFIASGQPQTLFEELYIAVDDDFYIYKAVFFLNTSVRPLIIEKSARD